MSHPFFLGCVFGKGKKKSQVFVNGKKKMETEYLPKALMVVQVCLESFPVFNWIKTVCSFGQPSSFIAVIAEKERNAKGRNVTSRIISYLNLLCMLF